MLRTGTPAEAKSPRCRKHLTTTPGKGARTWVYFSWSSAEVRPGLSLPQPLFGLVGGEFERLPGAGFLGPGRRQSAPSDLHLDGDLGPDPGQASLLAPQFRLGPLDLAPGQFDLVPVRGRV